MAACNKTIYDLEDSSKFRKRRSVSYFVSLSSVEVSLRVGVTIHKVRR